MDEAVEILVRMLRLYAPSRHEEKLSLFLARLMEEKGLKNVYVDQVNNVIGEIGSGWPCLLLCGHLDTVPGYLKVEIEDGVVTGRGAVDAKSSLASMICAGSQIVNEDGFGKVIIAGVADEEGNGLGVKEFVARGIDAQFAIFGEPSGLNNITVGYKGRLSLALKCKARGAHASSPWLGVNAVEKVYDAYASVKEYLSKYEIEGKRYESLSCCLTQLKGGSADNVVPESCEAILDIRIPPKMECRIVAREIEHLVKENMGSNSLDYNLGVKILDMTEPFETDRRSLVVRALSIAVAEVNGKSPALMRKTGTGDMNVIGHALKIPVATYGPGDPHLSHTGDERISIKEYLDSIEIYKRAIRNLARLARKEQSLKNRMPL